MSLSSLLSERSKQFAHGQLADHQGPAEFSSTSLATDEIYIEVWLRRMWIVNVRSLWKKYHAAIYSEVRTPHSEFKQMITPSVLKDVQASQLDKTVIENQILMGPTPYTGGNLNIDIALLSVRSGDYSGAFLEVLSDLGAAAGLPYVGMAQPFLKPLAKGIDLLTGDSANTTLKIGWRTALKGRTGVYAMVGADTLTVDFGALRVNKNYELSSSDGVEIDNYPYFVFSVESSKTRNDWQEIPGLKESLLSVNAALKKGDVKKFDREFEAFKRTALLSPDLQQQHAQALISKLKQRASLALDSTLTSRKPNYRAISLSSINPFTAVAS
jgi:hypothetical protein